MRPWETPVPIPNTTVKTRPADGTALETVWESRWLPDLYGGVAQLGEHLPCKQGVKSSNLSVSIASMTRKQIFKSLSKGFMIRIFEKDICLTGLIAQPVRAHA